MSIEYILLAEEDYLPTYIICLVRNERYYIVRNDSKRVVVDREPEMTFYSRIYDPDTVLYTCFENGLVPGAAIAISVRAIDESVLKGCYNNWTVKSIAEL